MPKTVVAVDFDGKAIEVEADKLKWRPSAYGIVIKDGKLLLLKQVNGYDLPGGGMDLGEKPEETVVREVKEETGITVKNPELLAIDSSFYLIYKTTDQFRHCLMMYYTCECEGGELSTAGFDSSEQDYAIGPEWLPLDQLDDIKLGTSNDFRPYVKQVAGI